MNYVPTSEEAELSQDIRDLTHEINYLAALRQGKEEQLQSVLDTRYEDERCTHLVVDMYVPGATARAQCRDCGKEF